MQQSESAAKLENGSAHRPTAREPSAVGHNAGMETISLAQRLEMREPPLGRPIGFHHWQDLAFLHWRVAPELIAPLIPDGLTLDTWDGDAWVGLVPFFMSGVRPWWSPPVPGISNFAETNVRTYVHYRGTGPGVWFFSLDAASSLAVRVARWRWNLNYFRARMQVRPTERGVTYSSHRLWPEPAGAMSEIAIEFADENSHSQALRLAEPGSLDFFLVERYVMYMQPKNGELRGGRVWHRPYPLRDVRLASCEETMLASSGIKTHGPPCHVAFSPGVQVRIFAPYELTAT